MDRFREVLLSIYLFNEYRGYTKLEALEAALRRHCPHERVLADAVHAHARDERRHYRMFRAWFVRRGAMPFRIDARAGYIDRLVRSVAGTSLDAVDLAEVVADDARLRELCRLVVLTEQRGLAQVRSLLDFAPVARDRTLRAMFEVVERDEPSHFEPYRAWLRAHGDGASPLRERWVELRTHLALLGIELPRLMLDRHLPRAEAFPA